jgi:c-di-GMP-related signal transduction protein
LRVPLRPAFWLGRQPIIDLIGDTVAYELLFRSGAANKAHVTDDNLATASVIHFAFNELGIASVLGDARGFINFDTALLMSDVVELLPPDRTVIELLEHVRITPEVVERCRELRERGFSFALDDVVQIDAAYAPLLPLIDIIKIDVLATAAADLPALVATARSTGRVTLLAEKVDTRAKADACRELGFDLFQGYFFARPVMMQGRRADPSKRVIMRLLEQSLDERSDAAEIERTFKQAPELTYKLMRVVNSVGTGVRSPIQSLAHALKILGRRQLQRWLQLLLFAHDGTGHFPNALMQLAAARGKLMELLVEHRSKDRRLQDRAFMTGILSLLDALLETPMSELIEHLQFPDDVRAALLERSGPLGHLLQVVEALERTDDATVSALLAEGNPCEMGELPQLQIAALAWSSALGREREQGDPTVRRRTART